jgi:PadR family transcriptional regulator
MEIIAMPGMLDKEVKRGGAEMSIPALHECRPRHGYEIAMPIEGRSGRGRQFHPASLYPLLYRMEKRGLTKGARIEKAGRRRRRSYKLMPEGKRH